MEHRISLRHIGLALAAGAVCFGLAMSTAWSQSQATTQEGIPYVSGGVGDEERAAMEGLAGQYNLKLEFARQDRAMLGDVQVSLTGPVAASLLSPGPVLLLKLPPGAYTVTATVAGVAKTAKVTVGKTGLQSAALFW